MTDLLPRLEALRESWPPWLLSLSLPSIGEEGCDFVAQVEGVARPVRLALFAHQRDRPRIGRGIIAVHAPPKLGTAEVLARLRRRLKVERDRAGRRRLKVQTRRPLPRINRRRAAEDRERFFGPPDFQEWIRKGGECEVPGCRVSPCDQAHVESTTPAVPAESRGSCGRFAAKHGMPPLLDVAARTWAEWQEEKARRVEAARRKARRVVAIAQTLAR